MSYFEILATLSHIGAVISGMWVLGKNQDLFTTRNDFSLNCIYLFVFLTCTISVVFLYKFDPSISEVRSCFYFTIVGIMSSVFHIISSKYLEKFRET